MTIMARVLHSEHISAVVGDTAMVMVGSTAVVRQVAVIGHTSARAVVGRNAVVTGAVVVGRAAVVSRTAVVDRTAMVRRNVMSGVGAVIAGAVMLCCVHVGAKVGGAAAVGGATVIAVVGGAAVISGCAVISNDIMSIIRAVVGTVAVVGAGAVIGTAAIVAVIHTRDIHRFVGDGCVVGTAVVASTVGSAGGTRCGRGVLKMWCMVTGNAFRSVTILIFTAAIGALGALSACGIAACSGDAAVDPITSVGAACILGASQGWCWRRRWNRRILSSGCVLVDEKVDALNTELIAVRTSILKALDHLQTRYHRL